jgi:methylenetetrahydrofolate--tRNA-(uracil-5-)-methyltransferase
MGTTVTVIGGGLAGSEAAFQAARRGGSVTLYEMKPRRFSPAHVIPGLAELVCSNSLKSEDTANASGLLKEEMRVLGSLIIRAAEATRVPAGKALAVDRGAFSAYVTEALDEAGVSVVREEVADIPVERPLVIATGPLTSDAFAVALAGLLGRDSLYFYDAVSPIVYADTLDMSKAFCASRYGRGEDDYINCPLDRDGYERFVAALVSADCVDARAFEDRRVFEGCMPIEEMARRGPKTLLFGPMRPVGLVDPSTGTRPYAVVQLRKENRAGTLYNIVGFQTRLRYREQERVLGLIPALERASYARHGKVHRNSYMDSPRLLDADGALKSDGRIWFAGQITGVEGYCESALSGLLAGINALRSAVGLPAVSPPLTTVSGALIAHVTGRAAGARAARFEPMNANFGLLPPVVGKEGRRIQAERALVDIRAWRHVALETSA